MENEIIIDKFKYEEPWEEFSRNILKMVIPKLKTLGYKLHISEEYLNIDGMQYWFKHPQRIAKLVLNIKSEKFTLDKQDLEKNFKKFTQKDIRIIENWFDAAIKNMIEKVQQPISFQVARRYDEVNAYSEQVAIKYCPQVVKDIFIF